MVRIINTLKPTHQYAMIGAGQFGLMSIVLWNVIVLVFVGLVWHTHMELQCEE